MSAMSAAETPSMIKAKAIRAAAAALLDAVAERASRTPREAAEAAFYPGHPLGSVDAIEAEIVRRREHDSAASTDQPLAA